MASRKKRRGKHGATKRATRALRSGAHRRGKVRHGKGMKKIEKVHARKGHRKGHRSGRRKAHR